MPAKVAFLCGQMRLSSNHSAGLLAKVQTVAAGRNSHKKTKSHKKRPLFFISPSSAFRVFLYFSWLSSLVLCALFLLSGPQTLPFAAVGEHPPKPHRSID